MGKVISGMFTFQKKEQGKEDFTAEEEHAEEVLKLMQQALLEERATVNSQGVTEGNCMIKY